MKILLLGIGNLLFGDEGVGVHFVNYMKQKYSFQGEHQLDFVDGGTLAQRLIPIMVEYDRVIIIDTINAPGVKAGELYFFNFNAVPDAVNWQGSAHEVEMLQTLTMMDLAGDRPDTMIMGIVPTIIEITDFSLSESVSASIPLMEETLLKHLESLGLTSSKKSDVPISSIISTSYKLEQCR
ncbi:hydrogenase maturation protease [Sulfurimonas aquatica]|uniref:Hydrogenase maturation protease n=1 Tax=Sulfurimonas aquatica TaxID=2672570 RepID=A0A975GCX0_9BACT|nr:HyaD/HybD family hydrogenase maturation endopeptidase [Sulfurimonas aquatica]QSZ41962.1 hydrogenase maturation protease [Sulfurimonas aquatica]